MKKFISNLLKLAFFLFIFSAGMFVGEFSQILYSQNDLRDHAITSWIKDNPQKADLAKKFKKECLIGKKKDKKEYQEKMMTNPKEDGDKRPLPISTIEKCANENNLRDIYIAIKEVDQILHSAPWPLSIINPEKK